METVLSIHTLMAEESQETSIKNFKRFRRLYSRGSMHEVVIHNPLITLNPLISGLRSQWFSR